MNKPFLAIALIATLPLAEGVMAQGDTSAPAASNSMMMSAKPAPVSKADKTFFKKAAIGGITEVEAGKLAASQGSSDQVKAFGQRMVDDHTKANTQLADLASKKNVTLPDAPDAKHQAMLDALKSKKGAAFDTAFISDMKKGHAEAIAAFTAATKSKDSDIAQFATSTLPTLKDHQKTIPTKTAMNGQPMQMSADTAPATH